MSATTPGVVGDELEILETKRPGEGVASTADRLVFELTYARGARPIFRHESS